MTDEISDEIRRMKTSELLRALNGDFSGLPGGVAGYMRKYRVTNANVWPILREEVNAELDRRIPAEVPHD